MVEKLTYEQVKNFLIDLCEEFDFNDVRKDRLKVGYFKKDNIAIVKGVRTDDGTLCIRFCDDELFFTPYFVYKNDLRKQKFEFRNHKNAINKFYADFLDKTFANENEM